MPRERQPALVRRIHRWLKPAGVFVAPWAICASEGAEEDWEGWGAAMWWSHFGGEANLAMLRAAGFTVASAETRTCGGETWLWVVARA